MGIVASREKDMTALSGAALQQTETQTENQHRSGATAIGQTVDPLVSHADAAIETVSTP
jgi:hypothetical protein